MSSHTAKASFRAIRLPMVWLMVLAILVYGHSGTLVQLLGPAHRHAAVAPAALASPLARVEGLFRDIRAWRADLHARLLPQEAHSQPFSRADVHAAGTGHVHSHDASAEQQQAHSHSHAAGNQHAVAPPDSANQHAALHDTYQRHRHDPHDSSVVSLDGVNGDTGPDSASQSSAGSATLPLALAPQWALPTSSGGSLAWPVNPAARWTDAALRPSERPPRG